MRNEAKGLGVNRGLDRLRQLQYLGQRKHRLARIQVSDQIGELELLHALNSGDPNALNWFNGSMSAWLPDVTR